MPTKIKDEQLSNLIVNQIKQEGLDNIFPKEMLDEIKNKVKEAYRLQLKSPKKTYQTPTGNEFPYAESEEINNNIQPEFPVQQPPPAKFKEPGSEPTDQTYQPVVAKAYTPEFPDVLANMPAEKLAIIDLNELEENGERLSSKNIRTMDNLDIRKSMLQSWKENGRTKADVFLIKFEKIGQLNFNYANGTTVFEQNALTAPVKPDTYGQSPTQPQENPYKQNNTIPTIDSVNSEMLKNTIKTSVDVESIIKQVTKELLTKALSDNSSLNPIPSEVYEAHNGKKLVKGVTLLEEKRIGQETHTTYGFDSKKYIIVN